MAEAGQTSCQPEQSKHAPGSERCDPGSHQCPEGRPAEALRAAQSRKFQNLRATAFFEKVFPMPQLSSRRDPKEGRPCTRFGQAQYFEKCRKVMTKRAGTQKAIPRQDRRILSSLLLFHSPRGTTRTTTIQRDAKGQRRKGHGTARSIEGLRGLRLSLVPRPESRNCLLQAL